MSKPAFDPNKPFEAAAKPAFDPNQPFTAGDDQQTQKPSIGFGTALNAASDLAPWNMARDATFGKAGEAVAEAGGSSGFPKTGAAIGTAVQMIPDFVGSMSPAETEAGVLRGPAEDMGRRALGFNKGMIKRIGGPEKANQVAGKMLDEGVITGGASPATMLDRAQDLSKDSGQRIGETLQSVNQPATTTGALKRDIVSQLSPGRRGGQYDKIRGNVNEIVKTVGAHGNGPISFESAQELKGTLQGPANFGKLTDGERAEMFRRSYGVVRQAIDSGLDKAVQDGLIPAEKAAQFMKDKATYGASEQAINALKDKLAGEAANNIISLRGAIGGAAGMATGDVGKALSGLGVWEAARRLGEPTAAAFLNYASKTRGVNTFRGAVTADLLKEYLNRRSGSPQGPQ